MLRKMILLSIFLSLVVPFVIGARVPKAPAELSAAQIADKNVQARGGLQAWRAVQTISYSGKMEVGGKQNTELPFLIQLKRPHKSRVEQEFQGNTGIQVYDGTNGWKLRPWLGRRVVEPYSAEELKTAAYDSDLDGPLVDYATKGTQVSLEKTDKVEGRDTYKLKLTLKDGRVRHVWVDTQSFLDVKIEGSQRRMDGRMRNVEVYLREYKSVDGLMIPYVQETAVEGTKQSHKMTIENVLVNPKLDDSLFVAPNPNPNPTPAAQKNPK